MLIHRVALTNIKSFEAAEIDLSPGLTAIVGPNGAGKSTILEAIGFGLFGYMPHRPRANFMRQGASGATIEIEFTSGLDERRYRVTRRLRRARSRTTGALADNATTEVSLLDVELNRAFDQPVAELEDFLATHVRAEGFLTPADVFEHVVGVPQGRLTADFLDQPRLRRERFDPILRTAEFRRASDELRAVTRHFGQRRERHATAAATLDGRLAREPAVQAALVDAIAALGAATAQHGVAEQSLRLAATELKAQEALRDAEAEAKNAQAAAVAAVTQAEQAVAAAAGRQQAAEAAARVVAETSADHARHESSLQEFEDLKDVTAQQASLVAARDAELANLTRSEQDLADATSLLAAAQEVLGAKAATPDLPGPAAGQRSVSDLRADYAAARTLRDERRERAAQAVERWRASVRDEAAKLERHERGLRALLVDLTGELDRATAAAAAAADRDARVDSLHTLRAERTTIEALLASEQTARDALVRQGICPFFENSCRNLVDVPDVTRVFDDRAAGQRRRLAGLEGDLQAAAAAVDEADRAATHVRAAAELRLRVGQTRSEAEQVTAQLAQAGPIVTAATAPDLDALAGALNGGTEARADSVADPVAHAAGQLLAAWHEFDGARRDSAPFDLAATLRATAVNQRDRDRQAVGAAEAALSDFAPQVGRLQAATAAVAATREAHELFLRNQSAANQIDQVRAERATAAQTLTQAQAKADAARQAVAAVAAQFDASLLAQAVKARDEALGLVKQLDERVNQLQRRRLELEAELEALVHVRAGLDREQAALRRAQDLEDRTEFIREILRRAAPRVTEALLAGVSDAADEIFGDILGDRGGRLRWTADYDVVLDRGGHTRQFSQLSGGEQMSAALAVRLALLRELLQLDIAFFDEPTQHLDDIRRTNLAEQIMRVRGFSQLVVISHDDTFERALDVVIRVRKINGVSSVEPA